MLGNFKGSKVKGLFEFFISFNCLANYMRMIKLIISYTMVN